MRSPEQGDHAVAANSGLHLVKTEGAEFLGDDARCPLFTVRKLWMTMKITPVLDQFLAQ